MLVQQISRKFLLFSLYHSTLKHTSIKPADNSPAFFICPIPAEAGILVAFDKAFRLRGIGV
jgi:hypothetical protein